MLRILRPELKERLWLEMLAGRVPLTFIHFSDCTFTNVVSKSKKTLQTLTTPCPKKPAKAATRKQTNLRSLNAFTTSQTTGCVAPSEEQGIASMKKFLSQVTCEGDTLEKLKKGEKNDKLRKTLPCNLCVMGMFPNF
jgi:16S rRNA G1207 methylase RsmC